MRRERRTVRLAMALGVGLVAVASSTPAHAQASDPPSSVHPGEATPSPTDPLSEVIPIPSTDNRTGGDHPSEWRPRRTIQTTTGDVILTGAFGATAVGAAIFAPRSDHVRGGVLFDEDARNALRMPTQDSRYAVRDMSDVGVSLLATWPFLVDALVTTWWHRGDVKLARNMALVSAEALTLNAALQGVTNGLVSRERPYGRDCGQELPEKSIDCEGNVRYRSFFSGHSSSSFTAAGVLCVHHIGLGLLGGPWDAVTCVTGMTVAATTALFRVMGDMHYLTDITVGAVVGTTVGLIVPWLHLGPGPHEQPAAGRIDLRIAPVGKGVGLVGTF